MLTSLTNMFQMIEIKKVIPKQWEEVVIQSIEKKKRGSKLEDTERGIFLTNTISKIYESVKKIQNENVINNIDTMQMAGRKSDQQWTTSL